MPFDGFVTKCVAEELNIMLTGGRIDKVHQPERNEIHLAIRNNGKNYRLLICSNASAPRIHLTGRAGENPEKAPMFCMILRKYIGGGRIAGILARDLERVVEIRVESANELGDMSVKTLIAEIMGKHSNIILINDENRIIDSLTHVDQDMSSVREVMPARAYSPPPPQNKIIPGDTTLGAIAGRLASVSGETPMKKISSALLDVIMGASPLFCRELCYLAGLDDFTPLALVGARERDTLMDALAALLRDAAGEKYAPCAVLGAKPSGEGARRGLLESGIGRDYMDYYCWKIGSIGSGIRLYGTMSEAIDDYYAERAKAESLGQRKARLVKLVAGNMSRCKKKLSIQEESIRDAAGYEGYKLYGELITANIHNINQGAESARLLNYYSEKGDEYIDIALDADLSPQANAQAFFRKYRKAFSTLKNARIQAEETRKELSYLESVSHELEMSGNSREIDEIRQELASQNYISEQNRNADRRGRRTTGKKGERLRPSATGSQKNAGPSAPHTFVSTDGLTIYIGKNNRQNDQLTLKTAASNDIWLHTRAIPGSHVIVKKQQGEIPDSTLLEAASLAAYFSKARMDENVAVDYTAARHVRKPSGAKPGMVIYDNQRTLTVKPDESLLSRLASK